jgi:hypothetical protein
VQGIEALQAKLMRDHHALAAALAPPGHADHDASVSPILAAANESTDTAFCLIRLPFSSGNSERLLLLKLDLLLDDTVRRVLAVTERGHAVDGLQIPQQPAKSTSSASHSEASSSEASSGMDEMEEPPHMARGDEPWGAAAAGGSTHATVAAGAEVPGGGVPGPGHCTPQFPTHMLQPWAGDSTATGAPGVLNNHDWLDMVGCGCHPWRR